jgi:hypothetical protein
MILRQLAVFVLLLLMTACPTPPSGDGTIQLGGEGEPFALLSAGSTLQVERGSQGGMHVWASLRAEGIDPGPTDLWQGLLDGTLPLVQFELEGPDGLLTRDNTQPVVLERAHNGYERLSNLVVFEHFATLPDDWTDLDYAEVEAAMQEQDYILRVRLTDGLDRVFEDSKTVRLSFPPRDQGEEIPLGEELG